jgi:hypothetical protein
MLYRVVLAVLLVVAVALTLNERRQEQRAQDQAERLAQAPSVGETSPILRQAPPAAGSASSRPAVPFVPHRVRVRREIDLLQAPEPMAQPVQPVSKVPPGILVQAVDERNGWYLVDTNLNRGWAPDDAFDEP